MANKRKCRHCGEYAKLETMRIVPLGAFCGMTCISAYSLDKKRNDAAKAKLKKERDQEYDNITKARRDKINDNSLPHQHKLTQPVFNRMRVLEELLWFQERGLEPYCISCQKTNMDWCCGHFKTVGGNPERRYMRGNTFLQCNKYCNQSKSGNWSGCKSSIGYIEGLKARFGEEYGQFIYDLSKVNVDSKKWTCEALKKFRGECSARVRQLEQITDHHA